MEKFDYEMIIIGGGPAGLTAGLYAGRSRLKTLLVEELITGGQVQNTDMVDNYPGFPEGVAGYELSQRMLDQAKRFGLEIRSARVAQVQPGTGQHTVMLEDGGEKLTAGVIIIASGAKPRKLGVPGEAALLGKGVSYCATCDGAFFRDETIAVVGGGDTALEDSMVLTRFAQKVHLLHRRDAFRGTKIYQEKVLAHDKIEVHWNTVVQEILGDRAVEALRTKNVQTQAEEILPVSGVFIFVGIEPNTAWLGDAVARDRAGFIITDAEMATSVPGIYAAGDVRVKMLRQISTAVGDGATAAFAAEKFLEEHR